MEVSIEFTKDTDDYVIKRCRGGAYGAQILKNDIDITPDSVTNIDAKIQEIIGVSYGLFSRIVVFNGNTQKFLDMPVNDQRNFIEELFRITELTQKSISLKESIRQTENSIEIEKAIVKEKEIQKQTRARHISEAETRIIRWENDKTDKIEKIQYQLERIKNVDFDEESKKLEKIKEIESKLTTLLRQEKDLAKTLKIDSESLSNKRSELSHLQDAKCPYCLQSFENAAEKIEVISNEIAELESKIQNITKEITQIQLAYSAFENDHLSIKMTNVHRDLSELLKIQSQAESLSNQLIDLENSSNPHTEAYEVLLSENDEEINTEKLDAMYAMLEHQKFLLKLLIDKNSFIRKAIIGKSIPFLNKQIEHYTKELLLPHAVSFEPDMTCTITEYGRELDHGNLSAGEQKRLNLALSLAFRDVLTHLHSKINLMLCDEIDGGSLCIPTMNALIELIKRKSKVDGLGVWCISHSSEFDGRLDTVMYVRKENGFSSISED